MIVLTYRVSQFEEMPLMPPYSSFMCLWTSARISSLPAMVLLIISVSS